jgi:hypothetical protein
MIRFVLLTLVILGIVLGASPASAQTCFGDRTYQSCSGSGGSLSCSGDLSFYATCHGTADGQTYRGTTSTDGMGNLTFNGRLDSGQTFRCTTNEFWSTCR